MQTCRVKHFFVPCYLHFVLWPITVCQGCWNVSLQPLCWAALQELRNLPGDVKWKYTPRIIFTWIISCLLFHYFSQTYLTPSAMKCVLGHTFSVYNHSFSISFTPPKRQRLNHFSFANPLSRSAPSFPTAVCRHLMCAKRKGVFFLFFCLFTFFKSGIYWLMWLWMNRMMLLLGHVTVSELGFVTQTEACLDVW